MKWFFFLALLLVATPAAGQVADTTLVIIEGDLAEVLIQVPDTIISIGDTIFFFAETVDSDGDPVDALLTWSSSNLAAFPIDEVTGVAVALTKDLGGVEVYVQAVKIGAMILATFRDGELNWSGFDTVALQLWEPSLGDSTWYDRGGYWVYDEILVPNPDPTLQYCAYLVDPNQRLLVENPGPPTCPIVFLPPRPRPASLFPPLPRPACFIVLPV